MNESVTYAAVHQRLRRRRGRVTDQLCVECSNPAVAWAYDKSDPEELTEVVHGGKRVTYSADLAHYEPLCMGCHHRRDHPQVTHCKRGHEYTIENTYTKPAGGRACRTCKRLTLQVWRAANPEWRNGMGER